MKIKITLKVIKDELKKTNSKLIKTDDGFEIHEKIDGEITVITFDSKEDLFCFMEEVIKSKRDSELDLDERTIHERKILGLN